MKRDHSLTAANQMKEQEKCYLLGQIIELEVLEDTGGMHLLRLSAEYSITNMFSFVSAAWKTRLQTQKQFSGVFLNPTLHLHRFYSRFCLKRRD